MSAADVTIELWQIASKRGNLTDEELENYAGMTSDGCSAFVMADALSGIGSLISDDVAEPGCAGGLQGEDAASLLFALSDYLSTIGAREFIASEAAFMLKERYRDRAEARTSK